MVMNQIPKLDRQTGRTTRLADEYVQMVFNNKNWIQVVDHMYKHAATERLFNIVRKRINREHTSAYIHMDFRHSGLTIYYDVNAHR